ncbi:hypothetical protein F0L74_22520 [Chitinophaga agrisoli]|uniref:YhhN-like protein n=1 Tax=Chitinophaga agrisoli TaxID=2607653 RepID=A0A5B2VIV3_9BACT|nr:hypothetical protein [Chitinophaga agrisoli]KAA2238991.1 hypothetical protein F0L74_22520 [Chitinophaga agrisoli]
MPSFTSLYLGVVVPAATLIPITMGIFKFRALTPRLRALWLYLCMAAVINAIASIYSHHNNLPLLHVYTMLELIFLVRYYLLLFTHKRILFFLKAVLILFPLYCVINFLFIQDIYSFNSYTRPVEAIILIACSLLYFMASSREDDEERWTAVPDNWVNAGILLYFSGALGQFAFSNVVEATTAKPVILLIWVLHATLVLIMYILFTISFSKCRL